MISPNNGVSPECHNTPAAPLPPVCQPLFLSQCPAPLPTPLSLTARLSPPWPAGLSTQQSWGYYTVKHNVYTILLTKMCAKLILKSCKVQEPITCQSW